MDVETWKREGVSRVVRSSGPLKMTIRPWHLDYKLGCQAAEIGFFQASRVKVSTCDAQVRLDVLFWLWGAYAKQWLAARVADDVLMFGE